MNATPGPASGGPCDPGDDSRPTRIVLWIMGLCVIAPVIPFLCVFLLMWPQADRESGRVVGLLAEGECLARDGGFREAESRFRDALYECKAQTKAEIAVRLSLLSRRRGIIITESVTGELESSAAVPGRLPPGFADFVRAELLVLDGAIAEAGPLYEKALARCDERLRGDIMHAVDHIGKWGATERFCFTTRITTARKKERFLRNMTFRPYVDAWLTLFACVPSEGKVLIVLPDGAEGALSGGAGGSASGSAAADNLHPAGSTVHFDCTALFGKRLSLSEDLFGAAEGCFCVLATEERPDRAAVRARLEELFRKGRSGEQAVAALEADFGSWRAVLVTP